MSEVQNLHNKVLSHTKQYLKSLDIEKQLIKVIQRSKGFLPVKNDLNSETNFLQTYFEQLIDSVGAPVQKPNKDISSKIEKYNEKIKLSKNRLQSVSTMLIDIEKSNASELVDFYQGLIQSFNYQKKVVEQEITEFENVIELTERLNHNVNIFDELEDKLIELHKLVKDVYVNEYVKVFGDFLGKKVYAKYNDFNTTFVFTQIMKNDEGSLEDKMLSFLTEYFELFLFIQDNQSIFEVHKVRQKEFYQSSSKSSKKPLATKRLDSFLIKHKEFQVYLNLLGQLSTQVNDKEWYDASVRNIQKVLMERKSINLINKFNDLVLQCQQTYDSSEPKDITIEEFAKYMGIEMITEERKDLIAQSYQFTRFGSKPKKDTRTVIIGFRKNDVIFS